MIAEVLPPFNFCGIILSRKCLRENLLQFFHLLQKKKDTLEA